MIDASALAKSVHDEARYWAGESHYSDAPDLTKEELFARMRDEAPLADEGALARVIEEVFWASMLAEEGRPCLPRVLYEPGPDGAVHRFASPPPLSRRILRKLSPAQGDGLVWEVRGSEPTLTGLQPGKHRRGVRVSATGPGAIDVAWAGVRLLTFVAGECLRVSTVALGNLAQVSFEIAKQLRELDIGFVLPVLQGLVTGGHGGSLWVIPEGRKTDGITIGQPLESDPRGLSERFAGDSGNGETRIPWLSSIAKLAAVDGAVLMDSKLRLLGFGAFVKLGASPVPVQKSVPGPGWKARLTDSADGLGGRHRSAAEFCHFYAPACAFVVSEDGGVSAFFNTEKDGLVQCQPVVSLGFDY